MDAVDRVVVPTGSGAPGGSTNAYLVGSDPAVLVDPGARSDRLDDLVARRRVEHIVSTHSHPDHIGALSEYAAETGATVWARAGREERFTERAGCSPDRSLEEGTQVGEDPALTVLETPGHAPDHVAFLLDAVSGKQVALVGDLVFADGSVFVGVPEGDMRTYLVALRRLRTRPLDTAYPGHGRPIETPIDRIDEQLAHRRDRERRVLDALNAGANSVDEILERAYDQDLSEVRDLAARTVQCHLIKLGREGHFEDETLAALVGERRVPTDV